MWPSSSSCICGRWSAKLKLHTIHRAPGGTLETATQRYVPSIKNFVELLSYPGERYILNPDGPTLHTWIVLEIVPVGEEKEMQQAVCPRARETGGAARRKDRRTNNHYSDRQVEAAVCTNEQSRGETRQRTTDTPPSCTRLHQQQHGFNWRK